MGRIFRIIHTSRARWLAGRLVSEAEAMPPRLLPLHRFWEGERGGVDLVTFLCYFNLFSTIARRMDQRIVLVAVPSYFVVKIEIQFIACLVFPRGLETLTFA